MTDQPKTGEAFMALPVKERSETFQKATWCDEDTIFSMLGENEVWQLAEFDGGYCRVRA